MSEEILNLEIIKEAVKGKAAAFRCVAKLQPAGGQGDKIFPPTYEGGKYAVEQRIINGQNVQCVLLDSVQSQANRMELALLQAIHTERLSLPIISVHFNGEALKKKFTVTSLDAPHRIADAILRDSLYKENDQAIMFRRSRKGKILDNADVSNATELFGICPTALLFGMWDSTGPRGGLGAKFQRSIVSEIIGVNAVQGVKTSSRIDPAQIMRDAGPVYHRNTQDNSNPQWTLNRDFALKENNAPKNLGKDGKPSEANHGNITPNITDGGFTIDYALQTTVLSLVALNRLRFPHENDEPNYAARTVLAALGLAASTLAMEEGYDLRSRCQLFPTGLLTWELLSMPGKEPKKYRLEAEQAIKILSTAVEEAKSLGLPWEGNITLEPSSELVALVQKSQEISVSVEEEEE